MGDDTALPPLAGRARPLYTYFRQRFAQVTNPPIDHLRERHQFSLRTILGGRAPLLTEGPDTARGTEFESFFLYPDALDVARLHAPRRDRSRPDLHGACVRLADEAEASVRAGRTALADLGHRRPACRSRCCSRSAPSTTDSSRAGCARSRRSSSRPTRRVRHTTSPACSATARRRSARGSRSRRWPHSPRRTGSAATGLSPDEAQRRFRAAIEDGVLKIMSKMGIADVAAYCGAQIFDIVGLAPEVVELCFAGDALAGRRHRLRRARARGARPGRDDAPGEPRLRQVPQGRRAARDGCGRRRALHTHSGSPSGTSAGTAYERFAELVDSRRPDGAPRPARARSGGRAGAAGRGRAGRVDRPAVLGRRACRTARSRPRRTRRSRSRSTPARPLELRRGRGRPGALPHRAQLADQAGRLRPLRRHAGVRGLRRRAPDQDRPGLEARRGRPAPRAQGLGRDRAAAAYDAGRGADLAAAAPRHLLDRGSRAADLRPPAGQPDREDLGQAGGRERCRPRRQRRRQGARRRRPHRRLRRRHRREPALVDQERRAAVGARAGRDTDVAGRERPARARPAARRRRREDRP